MSKTIDQRFWEKVDTTGACWIWTGAKTDRGYGQIGVGDKMIRVHRWVYERMHGPIAANQQIDHLCRVRLCVKPSHLEAVTQRENLLRGTGFSAINAAKTHCINGHPFDDENTKRDRHGYRKCRACHRLSQRKRAARN